MKRRFLATVLIIAMAFCLLPTMIQAAAPDATASTMAELNTAINNAPTDGTLYTIEVTQDITITSNITITGGRNILIRSDSTTRTLTRGVNKVSLFTLTGESSSSALTLENIIIDGAKTTYSDNDRPLIGVYTGQTLKLSTDAVLQNNVNAGGYGGGVTIYKNSSNTNAATFSMDGATLKNNEAQFGAGFQVNPLESNLVNEIIIKDSTITGNRSTGNGGGFHSYAANISISGTTKITNNTAVGAGGGIALSSTPGGTTLSISGSTEMTGNVASSGIDDRSDNQGGAIYINRLAGETTAVILNISGTAKIQNNEAGSGGAIYTIGANVKISTSTPISGNASTLNWYDSVNKTQLGPSAPGAIYVQLGNLTLENGVSITGSSCAHPESSAVYVHNNAILTMKSGSSISNNGSAQAPCRGITIVTGTIDMQAGSEICGNFGTSGGGINLSGAGGTIAGKVSGNTATTDSGGGIYFHAGSPSLAVTLTIVDGAEITNNIAALAGGGIYVNGSKYAESAQPRGILKVEGGTISGNTAKGTDTTGKDSGGGGIGVARSQAVISGGTITNNTAVLGAGGVQVARQKETYIGSGILTLKGGDISGNTGSPANLGIQAVLYGEIIVDGTFTNAQAMTIAENSVLTVKSGATITNDGTVKNEGTVTNDGKVSGEGTITGNEVEGEGKVQVVISKGKDQVREVEDKTSDLEITSNGPYKNLQRVEVDGVELVLNTDYTASEGSTIITLSSDYLNKLSKGSHTLKVYFKDTGEDAVETMAQTKFSIGAIPKTGDESSSDLWMWIGLLSVITLAGSAFISRYRKSN